MIVNAHKRTFILKPADVERKWVVVDASSAPLGRVATLVAQRLVGKYNPSYTPHVDSGDHVIVINAGKPKLSGAKMDDKTYYRHTGFPGGIKATSVAQQLEKNPARIVEAAVKGMLPKNKLAADRMARLRVYAGSEHQHQAQKPESIGVN